MIEGLEVFKANGRLVLVLRLRVLLFRLVRSARSAEPAFIVTFVDGLAPLWRLSLFDLPPQLAHALIVKRFGGAHEDIVTAMFLVEAEGAKGLLELGHNPVGIFLWCDAAPLGKALDVYPVFVSARKEVCLVSSLPVMAPQAICDDGRIETAKMGDAIGVVDRSCDVKSFHLVISDR